MSRKRWPRPGGTSGPPRSPPQAQALTRAITDSGEQAAILANVAGTLTAAGRHEQAAEATAQALALDLSMTSPYFLGEIAGALARAVSLVRLCRAADHTLKHLLSPPTSGCSADEGYRSHDHSAAPYSVMWPEVDDGCPAV